MTKTFSEQCAQCPSNGKSIFSENGHDLVATADPPIAHRYKKGEALFQQGTSSSGVFCLGEGVVKVFSSQDDGGEMIHRLASGGDLVGHHYLNETKTHQRSAVAVEDTSCCYFSASSFTSSLEHRPQLLLKVLKKVEDELTVALDQNINLVKKSVRERLASYFLEMSAQFGEASAEGMKINVQLTREEIASYLGTAHETAIRFISEFKALGFVIEKEKFFYVLEPKALEELTHSSHLG